MKVDKTITDKDFWELADSQKSLLARKNCKYCKGIGTCWVPVVYSDWEETDLIRCKCTKIKELNK